ncbi:Major cardiolipin synthase ClsA [Methanocorpusculaceae archaeon Sp1]|nr:Major cardiolipin synthase ClsA [Methanocorpusculaceae archaeon Sp1]
MIDILWNLIGEGVVWFVAIIVILVNIGAIVTLLFLERRNPQVVAGWLLLILLVPIIGFVVYLFFGRHLYGEHIFSKKTIADEGFAKIAQYQYKQIQEKTLRLPAEIERFDSAIALLLNLDDAAYSDNNQVDVYTHGEDKFAAFKEAIKSAEHHIHMEYYILRADELGREIIDLLAERAAAGVEVRVLFDAVGVQKVKKEFYANLTKAGGRVAIFFPLKIPFLNTRINFRNHRKILVVDGKTGFIGGFNIGDEYLGKGPLGYWRDTHLRIHGAAVASLQTRFIMDWNYTVPDAPVVLGSHTDTDNRYYPLKELLAPHGTSGVQIASSGPDGAGRAIYSGFVSLIGHARKSIYIHTPYFIPDETIFTALLLAIRAGIDVRIVIPCKPDHPFVYWASYSYLGDLVRAGAKGYTYDNGFIHSKTAIIDGVASTIGTANWDIRSFKLNFETNAFVYDETFGQMMNEIMTKEMEEKCTLVTAEIYNNRPNWIKFKEGICRLVSPLL